MDAKLSRVIAAQRRRDLLFNVFGAACTLVGIVTLVVLLGDLALDAAGLLGQYHRELGPAADAKVRFRRADDGRPRMALTLEQGDFEFDIRPSDAGVVRGAEPGGQVSLEGNKLRVLFGEQDNPDVVPERVDVRLTPEQVKLLTAGVSRWTKARQVFGRFLSSFSSSEPNRAGILAPLVGSLLVIVVTIGVAVPLGIAAGVYLEEYARKNWLTTLIEINISNLASVPSILYGLMALGVVVYALGRSVLAGGITLAFLILPIVIVATRESLRAIPQSIREAATALGATRWQVVWHHLLPYSAGGISTGVIIGVSRALGETAPLVTIGAVVYISFLPEPPVRFAPPAVQPFAWMESAFTVMPIQMFNWVQDADPEFKVNAAAAGLALIACTLSLNAVAIWLRYRLRRRIKW